MSDIAIRVKNIAKKYRVPVGNHRHDTLRDQISHTIKSFIHNDKKYRQENESFWALKDISFEVKQGEILGIIGKNGAGKSTLLKILSRITQPTLGYAEIYGRVGSLLEVGTGFHPELTGRENIYLNGAIIGMTKEDIRRKFDAIVDFAEIESFIDMPVKRYSSGMYVRLAFSVSAHLLPEILVIDEVLAVGDLKFQRKCMQYTEELRKKNATILFVSHNMFSIKALCTRVILLSGGKVHFDGSPGDAIATYEGDDEIQTLDWARNSIGPDSSNWDVSITGIDTFDEYGERKNLFSYGERMKVRVKYKASKAIANANFLVSFIRSDEVACCNYNTTMDGFAVPTLRADGVIELLTPPLSLIAESYKILVLVRDTTFEKLYCGQGGKSFHVRHDILNTHFGVFHEKGEWSIPEK